MRAFFKQVAAVVLLLMAFLVFSVSATAQTADTLSTLQEGAETLANSACEAARNGEYDKAKELFLKAISANQDDAGADYDPWQLPPIDKQAEQHGQLELLKMLVDRPRMVKFLSESDDLYRWTKQKYAAKILGRDIDWDPTLPTDPRCLSQHSIPDAASDGKIRLRDAPARVSSVEAFEGLWYGNVFELHNLENAESFHKIYDQARKKTISEQEFVKSMFELEFKALQRTRKWYVVIYLPHAKQYDLPTNPTIWSCQRWGTADSVFAQLTDRDAYPWVPYSQFYAGLRVRN